MRRYGQMTSQHQCVYTNKKNRDTELSNKTCVTHTQRHQQIADDAISNL